MQVKRRGCDVEYQKNAPQRGFIRVLWGSVHTNGKPMIYISEKNLMEDEFYAPGSRDGFGLKRTSPGLTENDQVSLFIKIDELGSLVKAAKALGISYKTAWDTVNMISNRAGKPLVYRLAVGKWDGVTLLTDEGKKLLPRLTGEPKKGDRS